MKRLLQHIACQFGFHPEDRVIRGSWFYLNGNGPFIVGSCEACDRVLYLEDQNTLARYPSYGAWLDAPDDAP